MFALRVVEKSVLTRSCDANCFNFYTRNIFMIKPKAIDHIVLRTEHYQALIDFYCQVIGCVVERRLPEKIGLTQLRAGSALRAL